MEVKPAAGFILFRAEDDAPRFLLLRNARHATWGFPKGHREPNEGDLECALRELREETGLDIRRRIDGFRKELSYIVREGDLAWEKRVVYFLAEAAEGEVRLSPEHDRTTWAPLSQAREILQHDDMRALLDAAAATLSS